MLNIFKRDKKRDKDKNKEEKMDTRALLEENLRLTKKINRYIFWRKIWGLIKLLIIIVPITLGIMYLPPIIEDLTKQIQGILGEVENVRGGLESMKGGASMQGGGIDIGSLLQQYGAPR